MQHVKVDTPQYVCFNQKTGEIFSIGPSIEDGYQYIQVSETEVEIFKNCEANMADYVVAYNRTEKRFVIKKNIYIEHESQFTKIMPVDEFSMYDLLLTVDKKSKRCYISTGIELIDTMKTTNIDLQKEIAFSFTKKNDPHVLYDTATFNIADPKEAKIKIKDAYSIYASSDMATCMYKEL